MSRNVAKSVKDKLKHISRSSGWDMEAVLRRYVLERFLHRITQSPWREDYALKGGLLVAVYNNGDLFRPTSDIDLNGFDENGSLEDLKEMVHAIAYDGGEVEDGIVFDTSRLKEIKQREGAVPGGKIIFDARLDTAWVRVRVDVGYGNAITPDPQVIPYPSMLAGEPCEVLAYPVETTLSEKFDAMVRHGKFNTRLKDYYDCWVITNLLELDQETVARAILRTLTQQGRDIPEDVPGALSDRFAEDNSAAWDIYRKTEVLSFESPDLGEVVSSLREFYMPACARAREMAAEPSEPQHEALENAPSGGFPSLA